MGLPSGLPDAFRNAERVCVLTGAGVSAESGVPTFRDALDGLWSQYDPLELATPEAFHKDPELVWRWYRWRRELVSAASPNPGHTALAQMAERLADLTLVTQNVDNLHQEAGSARVIEIHGNLFVNRCSSETCRRPAPDVEIGDSVPICKYCGAPLRPGVVWFGEALPTDALQASLDAVNRCDLFLSVGTSASVWPAAGFADEARAHGARIVEINPEETELSARCDFRVAARSGTALTELLDCLQ